MAAQLVVVGDQNRRASGDPRLLRSLDVRGRNASREVRVFAQVLEITPAQRGAHQVHAGRQQDVLVEGEQFLGEQAAERRGGFQVPCAGERKRAGQGRGAGRVLHGTNALAAVEHFDLADAQPLDAAGVEQCNLVGGDVAVAEANFLFEGEAAEQVVNARL